MFELIVWIVGGAGVSVFVGATVAGLVEARYGERPWRRWCRFRVVSRD